MKVTPIRPTASPPAPAPPPSPDRRALLNLIEDAVAAREEADRLYRELRDSEHWFRQMFDALPAAIYTTDAQGRITSFNPAAVEFSGRTPNLGIDQWCTTWKLYQPDGTPLPHAECPMAVTLKEDRSVRGTEAIAERPDGTRAWFTPYPTPLHDAQGRLTGAVNMLVDITAHKEAEATRARLAAIVEWSDDAIVGKTLDGVITSWNRGAQRLFGYSAEEAVGRNVTLLIPPERREEEARILAQVRRGEAVTHFDTVRICKDGVAVDVSLTVSPIKDSAGRVIGASKIARDIGERKRAEAALREGDRRKDEFLAMLAHELRGPLAPLSNALEIMRLPNRTPEAAQLAATTAARQLRHLARLVDDLLDASRITRGKLILRRRRTELAAVVRQAVEAIAPAMAEARHQLTVTLPEQPVWVLGDAVRLAQVLDNLLTNACKYTEPGGCIALTVEQKGGEVTIAVKDDGIGIAADMLPHIFELFTQADQGLERTRGGLGIGLSLVQRLMKMHGGKVTAHSAGLGHGSEFLLRLPVLPEETALKSPPPLQARSARGLARRILVVDDNRDSATSLALMLKLAGHATHTAYDGEEAVAAAESFRPEVVLLDLGLPKLSGYDVARKIRQQSWSRNMVLIAVTGWGQDEDRKKSTEAGFDAHLVKPVDHAALTQLLAGMSAEPRL